MSTPGTGDWALGTGRSARRKGVIAAVLALIGLPVVTVSIEALAWFSTNADNGSFMSSGMKREYLLYVPKSHDRTRPTPLVISMHGAGLWGAAQKEISLWNAVADREGFIVVYPSARGGVGFRGWGVGRGLALTRDVRFIGELIDTISARYNIDAARIYANGLSNGGGMSFVLSCTMSDRIAAVGLVGSAQTLPWQWCTDTRAVPMISFHGTADNAAPYRGGTSWVVLDRPFPNQETWTANWARRNGCALSPSDTLVAPDVMRRSYTRCTNNAAVILYKVVGGGHTWPGGGPLPEWFAGRTTHNIDASQLMWEFFREHPLRASGVQ